MLCYCTELFLFDRLEQLDVPTIGEYDVLVKLLAAPINPSDINMIQGIYIFLSSASFLFKTRNLSHYVL